MREKGSGTRIAIERRFFEHGITLHPRLELGSSEAIKQAIFAGLGISAMSPKKVSFLLPDAGGAASSRATRWR